MAHTTLENDLDEFIISAPELYEKTKPDRIKALQPVVQDIMLKIRDAMAKSNSSITYQFSRGTSSGVKHSLNAEQVQLLIKLFATKGYTVKDTSYTGDWRDQDVGYYQLTIAWSVQ